MRRIEHTKAFLKDWKRENAGVHGRCLGALLQGAVTLPADDLPLPAAAHDHQLDGEWQDHRDCHLRPDLLLIYRKPDAATHQLVRLGSHSEKLG
jgi:mRNA interferase YafQ